MGYKNQINFAEDFTDMPMGRYRKHGDVSGEVFRDDHLLPALKMFGDDVVTINLYGIYGMGGSFIDEAFGGLIREHGYTTNELLERFEFESDDEFLVEEIISIIEEYGDWETVNSLIN